MRLNRRKPLNADRWLQTVTCTTASCNAVLPAELSHFVLWSGNGKHVERHYISVLHVILIQIEKVDNIAEENFTDWGCRDTR